MYIKTFSLLYFLHFMLALVFSRETPFSDLLSEESLSLFDNKKCPCGEPVVKVSGWIRGGDVVSDVRKYPWFVTIHSEDRYYSQDLRGFCGGALITLRHVLTAAHCLYDSDSSDCESGKNCLKKGLYIRLLTKSNRKPGKKVEVESAIMHPKYSRSFIDYDIGIMKLKKRVKCTEYSMPICISKAELTKVGSALGIAGYGMTVEADTESYSDKLREGVTEILKASSCKLYSPKKINNLVCTSGEDQEVCHADSGTVGMQKHNNKVYAVSVTNGGKQLCPINAAAFHARVSHYIPFIIATVKGKEYQP